MSRRAFDHRRMVRDARFLRSLWDVVDIRTESDDWLALPPSCDKRRRDSGDITLDLKSFLFEQPGEVFRCFEFLKAQLAKTEHRIDHHLRLFFHAVDLAGKIGFKGGFARGVDFGLREDASSSEQTKE